MSQPICVLCAYYHPRADPHLPDLSTPGKQTCAAGLRRLEHELLGVRAAFLRLQEDPAPEPGANDGVSRRLPGAPTVSPSRQPTVTGSRERRLPIDINRVDLLAPATASYVRDDRRDQIGRLSVADVLNEWVTAWREQFYPNERHPPADTVSLIDWIAGIRLGQVVDAEPAIADFADELAELRAALRHALGDTRPARVTMWGVACPRCELVSQLTVDPDDPDAKRECGNCGRLLTADEYLQHLRALVDQYRDRQDSDLAGG